MNSKYLCPYCAVAFDVHEALRTHVVAEHGDGAAAASPTVSSTSPSTASATSSGSSRT